MRPLPPRPRRRCWAWTLFAFPLLFARAGGEPLRVGVETDLDPITLLGPKGAPVGFAIEVINGIAGEMGFEVVYVVKPRAEMFRDFLAGRTDALANVVHTKERDATMAFSVTDLEFKSTLFVRKGDRSIRSVDDLRTRRIAGIPGSGTIEYLRARGLDAHFVPVPTQRDGLRALEDGRADASISTLLLGLRLVRDEHLTQVEATDIGLPELNYRYHIAVHPGDTARLALINEGFARLLRNGDYDKIYEKWIGPLEPRRIRFKQVQPFLAPMAILLAAILGALVWQRRLLRQLSCQARALRESEGRLTRVLEGSNDAFWDWDVGAGRVTRSDRWAVMLGYLPAEIESTMEAGRQRIHPEDLAAYDASQAALAAGGADRFSLEYRLRAKSGEWRWVLDRGKVIGRGPDGKPLRMAGTQTDITAEKKAEEERERLRLKMLDAQKLESLGVLAGGIAHDFNNLLTVILGNANLARIHGPASDQCLDQIEAAVAGAAGLCSQMLAYAGRGRFVVERIDLSRLVQDTARLLEASISKKAKLRLELGRDLPAVEADPSQLRQVVMNLVINASEALGDAPGEIRLATRRGRPDPAPGEIIHSFNLPSGEGVCLEVADTGGGMDAATLTQEFFDPFFTTKFAGRGLGLAAVLGIVRAHRGALTVGSVPAHGTTMRFFLPADGAGAPAAAAPEAPEAAAGPPGPGFVLVADDEPHVLAITDSILRRAGYSTVLATDGSEALARFRANPGGFAAVLLDLTMPGIDGAEALRQMRALNPAVRILLMSGYSDQDILDRLGGQKRVPILHKPFRSDTLLQRLAQVIAGTAV